ncbi:biotin--[acetyl-CoA-carboxylase] ligase [Acinetobacter sp. B5B]|uniref:biotin--[acetyl-CoA-carboxylase] ligase n=1 Tax=Acinetobacter baretiae TaxID=2605383 RepID=UPI0018C2DFB0|nr:biotin--[acetyl-CoA-carboxylase] ligase [Acinetobacter baretiae]MBF7683243.1 biotin--[acetyl-CoA-carboxylase] ligase [Acinetobacter baretiae]MBF7684390.1 biotin--[acetyl-CoA-carboxylase] ligase [Acinetobacter baretiae]
MISDTATLTAHLESSAYAPDVVLLKQTTTSTNDDVKMFAKQGFQRILVCSESQTQGRGQHHRTWVSPAGNIYLSTLVNTTRPLDGRLALEVALNVRHMPCLENFDITIKWPNDLYSSKGKWGGILVEPLSKTQAIVGIGINLFSHQTLQNLDQEATALTQIGHLACSRLELIAEIYLAIQNAGQWFNHHSQNLAHRFNQSALFKDQDVSFEHQHGVQRGIFLGIQHDGAVIIQAKDQTHYFYQGRLRPIV